MEFKLPFPTLKSLSSLRICLQWLNHRLGPFQNFLTTGYDEMIKMRERHGPLSIDGLQIPRSLKDVVGDVLCGIFKQVRIFWRNCITLRRYEDTLLLKEVQFFYFDAFERFDEKRTLIPIFQKKIAEEDDLISLQRLLRDAYDFWLLSEVDAIFRKIVAIASKRRRSEILMEGPQPELRDGKFHLVYRFVQKDAAQYLRVYADYADVVRIVLERESIAVAPAPGRRNWNFDAFRDHYELFEPSEREAFIEGVLSDENMSSIDIKTQLNIFAFLKQNNYYQRNWMLEFRNGISIKGLENLLLWPFTSLFIVTFEHLTPKLTSDDYIALFYYIMGTMPAKGQYGVLHSNLLVYYWSGLTADKKRMFATFNPYYFNWAVNDLKDKAPSLPDEIKTELDSLTDEKFSNTLRSY